MTISARNPVVKSLCNIKHSLAVHSTSGRAFISQTYVGILWSNNPEQKDRSG